MDELYQEKAADYLTRLEGLGSKRFLELHPHPVLLKGRRGRFSTKRLFLFKTVTGEGTEALDGQDSEAGSEEMLEARVIPIKKRDRSSPEHMIFLGRSPNNDLVVPNTMVSKLHAYFCQVPGERIYQLVDMDSTNGTFVNGERLLPSVKKTLRDGDEVAFGPEMRLAFFTGPAFCKLLQKLNPAGQSEAGCGACTAQGEDRGDGHTKNS
ncbi:MAG TPA: FHA domain-containing protein [Syntrophobacteria bacterium]|nr:FHA domain-containing protein [Syntrophobacteria bacterium]